jgi:hypothetical protein
MQVRRNYPKTRTRAMTSTTGQQIHKFVDMWSLPGVHPTNVEILQQLKTADTQHFTKNMDVVGTVSNNGSESGQWKKTHLIGVRTDIWQPDEGELIRGLVALKKQRRLELKRKIKHSGQLDAKQAAQLQETLDRDSVMKMEVGEIEKRRLVLKLFKRTSTRLQWRGTLEEMTTTEIHNSIGCKRNLLSTAVMLPRSDYVTHVEQNHRTFRIPSIFTCCYYDGQQMWNIGLKRRWFSIGTDFDVEANGKKIGKLDGKLIALGADSHIRLDSHPLNRQSSFIDLLTLFTASTGYHRAMRRSVKRRVKAAMTGQSHRHIIEDEELRLRHNGRAAA